MADIALNPSEARKVLEGYVNPEPETFIVGFKKVKGYYLEVHSRSYRDTQEVSRHFTGLKTSNLLDEELLEEEYGDLLTFLNDPMNGNIGSEEARELMSEMLDEAEKFFTCLITEETDTSFQLTEEQREEMESDTDE